MTVTDNGQSWVMYVNLCYNRKHIDKDSIYLRAFTAVLAVIAFVIWLVYKNKRKTRAIKLKST